MTTRRNGGRAQHGITDLAQLRSYADRFRDQPSEQTARDYWDACRFAYDEGIVTWPNMQGSAAWVAPYLGDDPEVQRWATGSTPYQMNPGDSHRPPRVGQERTKHDESHETAHAIGIPCPLCGERPPRIHRRQNPSAPSDAVEKYREFHRFDPKKIVACPDLEIPARVRRAGKAKWVTYRSSKIDPGTMERPRGTFDYIHEHDAGVETFLVDRESDTEVPREFQLDPSTDPGLVVLGKCLGFCFEDTHGNVREAQGTKPLPDLCCTPDGKCLIVVQSGKQVLAMMWGGALGVFARGIDG